MLPFDIQYISKVKTPFYLYDLRLLRQTLLEAKFQSSKYGFKVHYAIKANTNEPILTMISSLGFGADCVSGNEVKHAMKTGFNPDKIAFAGVGKTDDEINLGIEYEIFSFNVESIPELENINKLACEKGKIAKIALRINPNVDANTHHYITTGIEESKFGLNVWDIDEVLGKLSSMGNVKLEGLHFHIGSQITDFNAFKSLCTKANAIQKIFIERQIIVTHINMGGGIGIDYHAPNENPIPNFAEYFSIFHQFLEVLPGQQVHFELGRSLVGQCGSLISKVLYIKHGAAKKFAIIDASMTDLIRPALYQSYHHIDVLKEKTGKQETYDIVGPVCESTDIFRKSAQLPEIQRDDLIAIRSTGAYGQVMSSNYNLREKAGEIYFGGDKTSCD